MAGEKLFFEKFGGVGPRGVHAHAVSQGLPVQCGVVREELDSEDRDAALLNTTVVTPSCSWTELTYHFIFTGDEQRELTIDIRNGELTITEGLHGTAGLRVRADARTWFGFLAGERSLVAALLLRRLRLSGPPGLLKAFGAGFPS
jgi:hypothetical protein